MASMLLGAARDVDSNLKRGNMVEGMPSGWLFSQQNGPNFPEEWRKGATSCHHLYKEFSPLGAEHEWLVAGVEALQRFRASAPQVEDSLRTYIDLDSVSAV